VEDDAANRDVMQLVLELAGHKVFTAGTGQEALERAAAEQPDAVLLDLRLPDQSGQSVSKALRDRGGQVPRIIITSGTSLGPGDAARMGADAVLQKPFEPDQMLAVLR
jgi:CheY-like chemotaxis protein